MNNKVICPICHTELDDSVVRAQYEPGPADQELCINEYYIHILRGDHSQVLVREQVQEGIIVTNNL